MVVRNCWNDEKPQTLNGSIELSRQGQKWTEDELQYLSDCYGLMPLKELANRLNRSEKSVILAAHRCLKIGIFDNVYTTTTLGQILGISSHSIRLYAKRGFLKGELTTQSKRYGLNYWIFKEENIIRSLRQYPWIANIGEMEEHYFRSVVKEEWNENPWYTTKEAAKILKLIDYNIVFKYIKLGWLKAETKPCGGGKCFIVRQSDINNFLSNDPRPEHRHNALSRAVIQHQLIKGRPIRMSTIWLFKCPSCGIEIKIEAPPKLNSTEVGNRFLNIYVNGSCSHGEKCSVFDLPVLAAGNDMSSIYAVDNFLT